MVAVGLGFVTSILVARTLGPELNGRYAMALLMPALLAQVLNLGVGPANIFYLGGDRVDLRTARRTTERLLWVMSAIGCAIGAGVIIWCADVWLPGIPAELLWLALATLPLTLWLTVNSAILQGLQDFAAFNRVQLAKPAVLLLAVTALVWIANLGPSGAIVSQVLSSGVALFALSHALHQHSRSPRQKVTDGTSEFSGSYGRHLLGYGWKAHLSNILTFLNYRADMFLLNALADASQVGVYTVAVGIAERIWLLSQAVSAVLFPRLSELHAGSGDVEAVAARVARNVLWLAAISGAALSLVTPVLVGVFFGPQYKLAANAIVLLMPGIVASAMARVLANDLSARGRPELNAYAAVGVVCINIGANLLLIPRLGLRGAALATSLAYSVNAIIKLVLYLRLSGQQLRGVLVPTREDLVLFGATARLIVDRIRNAGSQ